MGFIACTSGEELRKLRLKLGERALQEGHLALPKRRPALCVHRIHDLAMLRLVQMVHIDERKAERSGSRAAEVRLAGATHADEDDRRLEAVGFV